MTLLVDAAVSATRTPIIAIATRDFIAYLANVSAHTRTWIAATGFAAKPHTHAIVPDEHGDIAEVLVGVSSATDVYALSHLPLQLPSSTTYCLAANSIISNATAALGWELGAYQFSRYKKPSAAPQRWWCRPRPR